MLVTSNVLQFVFYITTVEKDPLEYEAADWSVFNIINFTEQSPWEAMVRRISWTMIVTQPVTKFHTFMEHESSSPFSQVS
jgi:hypothetical protein